MNSFIAVVLLVCQATYASPQKAPKCAHNGYADNSYSYISASHIEELTSFSYLLCKKVTPTNDSLYGSFSGCDNHISIGCEIKMVDGTYQYSSVRCDNTKNTL